MKPWLIVTGDLVRTGGMDRANLALAEFLASQGRETHIAAFRADPELLKHRHLIFHRVPKPLDSYSLGMPLLARAGRKLAGALGARGARIVVNGGNCQWGDVNWVHYVHHAHEPAVRGNWLRRLRSRWSHRCERRRETAAFAAAKHLIVNSHRTAQDVRVAAPGVDRSTLSVVYYGIDPVAFSQSTVDQRDRTRQHLSLDRGEAVAIFIGALGDRRKGFDVVFEAWRQLVQSNPPPPVLLVVGSGAEVNDWRRRITHAGLDRSIRLLGFRSDVPDLLAAADVLIAPTRYEAYGLGVHEAICRGLPAIVSRSAGVAERYPIDLAEALLLNDPSDPRELVAKLADWRADVEGFRRRVAPFADALRSRSWDHMAAEFVRVVESGDQAAPPMYTDSGRND